MTTTGGRPTDLHIARRVRGADGAVLYDAATRPPVTGSGLDAAVAVQVRPALQQAMCCGHARTRPPILRVRTSRTDGCIFALRGRRGAAIRA